MNWQQREADDQRRDVNRAMQGILFRIAAVLVGLTAGIQFVAWVLVTFGGWWGLLAALPTLAGMAWLYWWSVSTGD